MASLADLYTFQTMVWMYIDAAMQRYAVLGPGGDGIRPSVVQCGHKNNGPSIQQQGDFCCYTLASGLGSAYG
jgi:hypothetical protein